MYGFAAICAASEGKRVGFGKASHLAEIFAQLSRYCSFRCRENKALILLHRFAIKDPSCCFFELLSLTPVASVVSRTTAASSKCLAAI